MDIAFLIKILNGLALKNIFDYVILRDEEVAVVKLKYNDTYLGTTTIPIFVSNIINSDFDIDKKEDLAAYISSICNKIQFELYRRSTGVDKILSKPLNPYLFAFGCFYVTTNVDKVEEEISSHLDDINKIIEEEINKIEEILTKNNEVGFRNRIIELLEKENKIEFGVKSLISDKEYTISISKYPNPDNIDRLIYYVEIRNSVEEKPLLLEAYEYLDDAINAIENTLDKTIEDEGLFK